MTRPRLLIAGIGNIFLGDDAFGVEVAQRLARRPLPEEVRVVDFGIRGLDLTYALLDGYEFVVLVDTLQRGGAPGTLYLLEPECSDNAEGENAAVAMEMHYLDPVKVLRLAATMGAKVGRLLLVGCEPEMVGSDEEMRDGLSAPVRSAVDQAIPLIESLAVQLLLGGQLEINTNSILSFQEVSPCRE
jgi:hydrogenase maturation protease